MKISDILGRLEGDAGRFPPDRGTCDTLKYGSPDRDVEKVAVTMFLTPDVVRQAAEWGAGLAITHEPISFDRLSGEPGLPARDAVSAAKEALILGCGLAVYRFHDHPHASRPDMIDAGFLAALGLDATPAGLLGEGCPLARFDLAEPVTPRAFARLVRERVGVAVPRVAGALDEPCTRLTLALGQRGLIMRELCDPASELVVAGECSEWQQGEYARDAAQLGIRKALVFVGHSGSERPGMAWIAGRLARLVPGVEVRYFDCGDTYEAVC